MNKRVKNNIIEPTPKKSMGMSLAGTKQSQVIDNVLVEIASRFVSRRRNDVKLFFGADS